MSGELVEDFKNFASKVLKRNWLMPTLALVVVLITLPVDIASEATAQQIKKSRLGICHCPGGQFYDRTSNFTAFDTIGACLESGGREPQRGQGTCPTVPANPTAALLIPGRYDRNLFGAWIDEDGD